MPQKRDRRHDNPGRPPLKLSEKQAARETKVRMSVATDKRVRAAAEKAEIGLGEWLRRGVELLVSDPNLLERIAQHDVVAHDDKGNVMIVEVKHHGGRDR